MSVSGNKQTWYSSRWQTLIDVKADNDEDFRLGRLFNTLMVISTIIVVVLVIVFMLMEPLGLSNHTTTHVEAAFPFVFIPLSLFCWRHAKNGHIKSSISIYVWTNFVGISAAAWVFDGIYSPAWILNIWTITIAGTLLTPIYSLWMTSGIVLYYLLLLILYKLNLYQPLLSFGEEGREYVNIACLLIMLMSSVGFLTFLNMRSLRDTLLRLYKEISERKQAEIKLNESKEKYRTVADFTYDWEYWLGPDGRYIYISPSCERITRYKADEFLDDPHLLTAIIHPQDRSYFRHHLDGVMTENCEVRRLDFRIITRSNEERWISHTCQSVSGSDGKWLGRRGTNRDITDQKRIEETLRKSEDKFRSLAENISDWIWEIDKEGKYIYSNPRSKDILGYESEEIIGKTPFDFMPPEEAERLGAAFEAAMNTPQVFSGIENINLDKNGNTVILETNALPIFNSSGECISYRGIDRDITERKSSEQKIKKINEELKELNATRDRFFSIIAHDLKSPFQGLLGYSEMLTTEYDRLSESEKILFIKNIYELSKNAYALLDNLLIWSRIQTGKMIFSPDVFNLRQELLPTINLLSQIASNKNISVENNIDGKTLLKADRNMLQTIIRNLVSNAIKFTLQGGKVVLASAQISNYVEISVSDTGVGMNRDLLENIFISGKVTSTKGTGNEGGTGLGLGLCYEMVKMHNGKIWAESKVENGTTFVFRIPSEI